MFHHVVLMAFSSAADQAFLQKVEQFAEQVRRSGPRLHRYVFRENIASRNDGLTHGIVSAFDTSEDHDVYQTSPIHMEMKAYMAPFLSRIVVLDLDEAQS
jgi:hypothetical protein